MPDIDSTLRKITQWNYIATNDLSNALYQIPLLLDSMKYCSVVTPFHGVCVNPRSAMGMPEDELLCRVLGDLLEEGIVVKLADDIYCRDNTIIVLQRNIRRLLQCLYNIGVWFSAAKTVMSDNRTNTWLGVAPGYNSG